MQKLPLGLPRKNFESMGSMRFIIPSLCAVVEFDSFASNPRSATT